MDLHEEGEIRPWDLPGEVAEGTYFRFFDDNIVAMAARGHGPRTTALSAFLFNVAEDDVLFDPLLRGSTTDYVASIDEVKRIEWTVTVEALPMLKEVNETLGNAIDQVGRASGASRLGIVFGTDDPEDRDGMWALMKGVMRDLASRDDLNSMKKARVYIPGEITGEEEIDLLKDRIAYQISVTGGGLGRDNAFGVLQQAYDRYRADFRSDD